jgi:hypothetical protein
VLVSNEETLLNIWKDANLTAPEELNVKPGVPQARADEAQDPPAEATAPPAPRKPRQVNDSGAARPRARTGK